MASKESSSGMMARTRHDAIVEFLEGERVPYELLEHEPAMTAVAEARVAGRSPDEVAKTVVLHDGRVCVIAAIPAGYRLDVHKLRALLGASRRLQLASEVEIARDFPSFEVGALPPFGPLVPAAEVIDAALMKHERILCCAGDHRHSVLVDPHDVVRMTAARIADISED